MSQYLISFESLRFIKHARERAADERRLTREHELAIHTAFMRTIETALEGSAKQNESNANAISELAKSAQAQAEGFATWIKLFQTTSDPTTSVIREEDEYAQEQVRVRTALGLPPEIDIDLPEEFRLALTLQQPFLDAVRRDGKP